MNEKQSPVIRLDKETNDRIMQIATHTNRTKVGVIRWLLESVPAVNGPAVVGEGKRMLAVQGLDGVLRVDDGIQMSDRSA